MHIVGKVYATALVSMGGVMDEEMDDHDGKLPLWKLSLVALPCMSVAMAWSLFLPNSASYLMQLGMSPALATLNNLAGPVTGFFTGPLVGAYSDSLDSPHGRRRPIIVVGLCSMWVAALVFASSGMLFPPGAAMLFAAPMLWVLDLTINVLQTPLRALVADLASNEQQLQMQVIVGCYQAIGFLVGFSVLQMYEVATEHMLELALVGCVINAVAVAVMLCVARERPLAPTATAASEPPRVCCTVVVDVADAVRDSSPLLRQLAAVHCLVFVGVFFWNVYSMHWFSFCVYPGVADAPPGSEGRLAYAAGQQAFTRGGQFRSILHLLSALLVTLLLHKTRIPARVLYASYILVGAVASYVAAFFGKHSSVVAVACMTCSVLPFVGSMGIPFGLIAESNKAAELRGQRVSTALQMSLLNCSLAVGQQVMTVMLAILEGMMAPKLALPIVLLVAGGAQFVGCAGAALLVTDANAAEPAQEGNAEKAGLVEGRATVAPEDAS